MRKKVPPFTGGFSQAAKFSAASFVTLTKPYLSGMQILIPARTMRQKVTELTKPAHCMSCHDQINSTGFVLENYDATGRNRSKIDGKPINLLVKYPDSNGQEVKFSDSNDLLKHALASSKPSQSFVDELFSSTLPSKLWLC